MKENDRNTTLKYGDRRLKNEWKVAASGEPEMKGQGICTAELFHSCRYVHV